MVKTWSRTLSTTRSPGPAFLMSAVQTFASLPMACSGAASGPQLWDTTAKRSLGAADTSTVTTRVRVTPGLSYLIPLFLLFQWFGMIGTLTPLVITHLVITVPIVVWVMIGFFEGLPGELEEAALVDGATIWQAFVHVAMPLARPGIMVAMILSFIFSWNNFIFGVVLAGRTTRTLPVAVYNVLTFEQISWGPLAAAALVVTAPVLLLTLLMQKEIVAGLTAGGVKGG